MEAEDNRIRCCYHQKHLASHTHNNTLQLYVLLYKLCGFSCNSKRITCVWPIFIIHMQNAVESRGLTCEGDGMVASSIIVVVKNIENLPSWRLVCYSFTCTLKQYDSAHRTLVSNTVGNKYFARCLPSCRRLLYLSRRDKKKVDENDRIFKVIV